jgi:hypothetical protein
VPGDEESVQEEDRDDDGGPDENVLDEGIQDASPKGEGSI